MSEDTVLTYTAESDKVAERAPAYGRRFEGFISSSKKEEEDAKEERGDAWIPPQDDVAKRVEEAFDLAYRAGKFKASELLIPCRAVPFQGEQQE